MLFRAVLSLGACAFVLLATTSGVMFSRVLSQSHSRVPASVDESHREPHEESSDESHDGAEESGEQASDSHSKSSSSMVIGVRAIPRSIEKRQDGIPEPDKDLVQQEIESGRGLASINFKQDETPTLYNPFFTYNEILGSTSENAAYVGRVAMDVAFEVNSFEAMKELQEREKEIKFMISSLVGEIPYDDLQGEKGRVYLKKRIYKEVNYILKKGKVKDVLYSNFVMK